VSLLMGAFVGLCVGSILGAVLFIGYTFRKRIHYPMVWVVAHISTISVTLILFTIAFVAKSNLVLHDGYDAKFIFFSTSYAVFLATFITGISFFFRYDFRRRHISLRLLSVHLVMSAFTFFGFAATLALYTPNAIPIGDKYAGSSWYAVHKHAAVHQK